MLSIIICESDNSCTKEMENGHHYIMVTIKNTLSYHHFRSMGVLVSVVLLISPTTWLCILICGLFNQDLVYGGKYADCLLIASS